MHSMYAKQAERKLSINVRMARKGFTGIWIDNTFDTKSF